MIAAANKLTAVADSIRTRHSAVRGDVEALVGSKWSGIAPRTHEHLWETWDAGYEEVVEALQQMAERITLAARQFESTDADNADGVSGAAGGLNMDVS